MRRSSPVGEPPLVSLNQHGWSLSSAFVRQALLLRLMHSNKMAPNTRCYAALEKIKKWKLRPVGQRRPRTAAFGAGQLGPACLHEAETERMDPVHSGPASATSPGFDLD